MAQTATKRAHTGARRTQPRKKAASKPAKKAVRFGARKGLKLIAQRAAHAGAEAIRVVADRGAAVGKQAVETGLSRRLPIQVSIDVAVPPTVAWKEWVSSGWIIEGVHRIEDVEREGSALLGRLPGPRPSDWEAEIVDEREDQSFAWRSVQGTDCAGLVTFHRLSDRLTRIELDIDVLPTNPVEALSMSLHLAHRRAEAELRRFKAHVEFINPDVYEGDASHNGGGPQAEADQ